MTCIVGYNDRVNRVLYLGADSASVDGSMQMTIRKDPKVFALEQFLIGFTSSWRMGQILQFEMHFDFHKPSDSDLAYLVKMATKISTLFKEEGFATVSNNVISGGTFVIGYNTNLYLIESDFQVSFSEKDYVAVGLGAPFALGCLHALEKSKLAPEKKMISALKAAEYFTSGVRRPWRILKRKYV